MTKPLLGLNLLFLICIGCGGAQPLPELKSAGVQSCRVAKDPLNPFVVEWQGTDRARLEAATARGIVVVSYMGCSLKVLHDCSASGNYALTPTQASKDSLRISNEMELYQHLPLGAAALKGELSNGAGLGLDYVTTGVRQSSRRNLKDSDLSGDCAGASQRLDRLTRTPRACAQRI